MNKISFLAFLGWSIVAGAAYAQESPAKLTRDRLCQEIKTGMSIQEVLGLATSVGIELVPMVGEDNTVFLEWSDSQTSEAFSASFFENSLANFSCAMIVSNPTAITAEPTTCDRVAMGMNLDAVKTLMNEASFVALPRPVGGNESLWEWSNAQTAEFIRIIFSNQQVVSVSCSTQANETELPALEDSQTLDNFLDFGDQLPETAPSNLPRE